MGGSTAGRNPLTDEFRHFALTMLEKWKVPGVSIAVIDDDKVYSEGYGTAILPDVEATADTIYYGASTSKAFTAAVLAHLISSQRYPDQFPKGWQTPISHILRDDFVLEDEWATNHITLEDAVSHRTGMPRHDRSSFHIIDGREALPGDIVRNLRNLTLTEEPRVKYEYCNFMFVVLSHVIETVTGKFLGDVLREEIWVPLGMSSTYFTVEAAQNAPNQFANGCTWIDEDETFQEVAPMPTSEISGAGAVMSTVEDYAKWIRCLIFKGKPFSEETHKEIRTPRTIVSMPDGQGNDVTAYALGWDRVSFRGHTIYQHSGGMHAYGAQVYWLPERKMGVVAMGNTAGTSNAVEEVLAWQIIQDHIGIPRADQYDAGEKYKKIFDQVSYRWDNAFDMLYPDRPGTPLPASGEQRDLVGTYYNKGYGKLHVQEVEESGKKLLAAYPENTTWAFRIHLVHVSRDCYVGYVDMPGNPSKMFKEPLKAEFRYDISGKPSSLEVEYTVAAIGSHEGVRSYQRIEED